MGRVRGGNLEPALVARDAGHRAAEVRPRLRIVVSEMADVRRVGRLVVDVVELVAVTSHDFVRFPQLHFRRASDS